LTLKTDATRPYDLGHFDNETCRLEPIDIRFGSKLLPMYPEWTRLEVDYLTPELLFRIT
jgi:hypothetical protein